MNRSRDACNQTAKRLNDKGICVEAGHAASASIAKDDMILFSARSRFLNEGLCAKTYLSCAGFC